MIRNAHRRISVEMLFSFQRAKQSSTTRTKKTPEAVLCTVYTCFFAADSRVGFWVTESAEESRAHPCIAMRPKWVLGLMTRVCAQVRHINARLKVGTLLIRSAGNIGDRIGPAELL